MCQLHVNFVYQNPLLNDPSAIYAGKKRKAHEQPNSGPDVMVCKLQLHIYVCVFLLSVIQILFRAWYKYGKLVSRLLKFICYLKP